MDFFKTSAKYTAEKRPHLNLLDASGSSSLLLSHLKSHFFHYSVLVVTSLLAMLFELYFED